jgi:hypothetical protein
MIRWAHNRKRSTGSSEVSIGAAGGIEQSSGIAIDSAGNICPGGLTQSPNFPAIAAFQAANRGGPDAFIVKLHPEHG